jgi:hypothetical protein
MTTSSRCQPASLRPAWVLAAATLVGCASGGDPGSQALTFGVGGPGGGSVTATDGDTDGGTGVSASGSGNPTATDGGTGQDTNAGLNCVDADGDSFGDDCAAGPDCNDDDPDINPGAGESCNGEDENCDGEIDNGCECADDGVSGDCNIPSDLGSIGMGQQEVGVVANVPQQDAVDWYVVSFPLVDVRPGVGMPRITFAINETESFAFDVLTERCGSTAGSCTDGGTDGLAVGLTDWTFVDDDPGCCTPPMDSLVAWPATMYVRVYRTSPGASCAAYQLQVSR